jgi:carotenoid cleavage dioxygenase-like enzyme
MPMSPGVSFGVTNADGSLKRRQEFQAPYTSMVHDFMVTENHVLLPILPLSMSLERAMSGRPPVAWEPEKGAYVGVMRRDGEVSSIRWFNTEACYVFHPLNAWEEGDKLFADVMRYDVAPLFPNADGSPGQQTAARLVRWTFDLAADSDAIREEAIDDLDGEFPRVDPRFETRKHRHGWYAADPASEKTVRQSAIAHLDLQTGKRQVYALNGGDLTSEPVFVPRRCARGRRLADGGGLAGGREPLGPPDLRGPGRGKGAHRHGEGSPPRAFRLPWQLGEPGLGVSDGWMGPPG